MKNILITGGAGFIGSNLALRLINLGYNVTILDSLSSQIHGEDPINTSPLYQSIIEKVTFFKGTVTCREDLEKSMFNQDAIIHLAAETGTGQSMYEIYRYADVNVGGTALLLDILANSTHNVSKLIIASSRAIYGEGRYFSTSLNRDVFPDLRVDIDMSKGFFEPKCPITGEDVILMSTNEDSKIHPTSVYGITKQNQEQMFLTVGKSLNIPTVAFRYQNVYGPGQSLSNPYTGILSIFSTRIKNDNDILIFEDGKESRDFVYIDDVVDATILGLEKDDANYQVFNVGSGIATTVEEVATTLKNKYNSDIEITVTGNYRLGDIRHNFADLTKINSLLGFQPKFNFDQGISHFVKWVNSQEIKSDNYGVSIDEMKKRGLYK